MTQEPVIKSSSSTTDAHARWQAAVDEHRIGRTLQLWADESRSAVGGVYDAAFDRGIDASSFLDPCCVVLCDTIVFHMIFGKWAIRGDRSFGSVRDQFVDLLEKSRRVASRLIVTEHNLDAPSWCHLQGRLPAAREVHDLVRLRWPLVWTGFAGGAGDPIRNLVVVGDGSG